MFVPNIKCTYLATKATDALVFCGLRGGNASTSAAVSRNLLARRSQQEIQYGDQLDMKEVVVRILVFFCQ